MTVTENMSDLERYFARLSIAGLVVTPSGIKSITTGNDVVMSITRDGKTMVRDIVTGTVIYKGASVLGEIVRSAGGNETNITGDGNTTSLHDEDVKIVGIGENAQSYKGGGSGTAGDEEFDTSEQAVAAFMEECKASSPNLGARMTCLSAKSGYEVNIVDEKVVIVEGEIPLHELNIEFAGHKDLGGPEVGSDEVGSAA